MPHDHYTRTIPVLALNRAAVRYSIDHNEADLAFADRMRAKWNAAAAEFAAEVKARLCVPDEDVTRFLLGTEDDLADLFCRTVTEIEDDVSDDKRLIGAE